VQSGVQKHQCCAVTIEQQQRKTIFIDFEIEDKLDFRAAAAFCHSSRDFN
jgi:hypothetical protein